MKQQLIEKEVHDISIIPVIAIDDASKAVDLADALIKGGIPAAEITFRTAAGQEAIRKVAASGRDILVGAGTVLNVEQCKAAIDGGAKFIVSPGYNESVVDYCLSVDMPVFPGCSNASEMTKAVGAGLRVVKFFPAEALGGIAMIKNLAPVFPTLNFMPTGGINAKNVVEYLHYDRIAACGGTWMVKKDLIAAERWDDITALCEEAVQGMLDFKLKHVGVNCTNPEEAEESAKAFASLFNLPYKAGNSSIFAGTAVEFMKSPYLGEHGHIGIGTSDVDRAIYHMSRKGFTFDESTRKTAANGLTKAVYLNDSIAGFAIHLVKD